MAIVKVHAGDFLKGDSSFSMGNFALRTERKSVLGEIIMGTEIEMIEMASEDSVKKIGGTLGWGAAGAIVLGPVGLLAGLFLGGKKKEVTFVARFRDGRKLLATTDSATYIKIQAAAF